MRRRLLRVIVKRERIDKCAMFLQKTKFFSFFFRDIIVRQRLYFLHLVGEFSPTEEFL